MGADLPTGVAEAVSQVICGTRCPGARVGVVAKRYPFWNWCLEAFGRHCWTAIREVSGPKPDDDVALIPLERKPLGELLREQPVEVLLFEDGFPRRWDDVWTAESVKAVVWFQGRKRHDEEDDWRCEVHKLSHHELGGVTDGVFHVMIATRRNDRAVAWEPSPGLGWNKLGSVTDPTVGNGHKMSSQLEPIQPGMIQTDEGLLSWKGRRDPVLTRSVFFPGGWVKRRLTPKELLMAMDAPATRIQNATLPEMEYWSTQSFVPFKIRMEVLTALANTMESNRKRLRVTPCETAIDGKRRKKEMDTRPTMSEMESTADKKLSLGDWGDQEKERALTSAKADDAEVPVYLWDQQVLSKLVKAAPFPGTEPEKISRALDSLRGLCLRWWKRRLAREFADWWRERILRAKMTGTPPDLRSAQKGAAALAHAADATWWEWVGGSAPFFWRFPLEFQEALRDGEPVRWIGPPPHYWRPYQMPKDSTTRERQVAKVAKARRQRYIDAPSRRIKSVDGFLLRGQGQGDRSQDRQGGGNRHSHGIQRNQLWSE